MSNNKHLIGVSLIALGLFLFWVFPYAEYQKISILQAGITERDAVIKERTAIIDNVKKIKEEYSRRGSELNNFSAVVPSKKSTAEILLAIEAIASQTGNMITETGFSGTPPKNTEYAVLQTVIKGRGGYGALKGMLEGFEKNIPLIDVQSIKMSLDPQSLQLNYEINAVTYYIYDSKTAK
jgi:hypothetical protein